jgi:hypothetical protein
MGISSCDGAAKRKRTPHDALIEAKLRNMHCNQVAALNSHQCTDHVSVLKFLERNWRRQPSLAVAATSCAIRSPQETNRICRAIPRPSAICSICSISPLRRAGAHQGRARNSPWALAGCARRLAGYEFQWLATA